MNALVSYLFAESNKTTLSIDVVPAQAGGQEQAKGRLIEPAEIGGVVDDAGGIAVAPLHGDGMSARERHDPRPPPAGR